MKLLINMLLASALLMLLCVQKLGAADFAIAKIDSDKAEVQRIFSDLDNLSLSPKQQLENYLSHAVILVPDQKEIRGYDALSAHLEAFSSNEGIAIRHKIVELNSFAELVVVQGRVEGTYTSNEGDIHKFETKNIILLQRVVPAGLKIWKVIYNAAPAE